MSVDVRMEDLEPSSSLKFIPGVCTGVDVSLVSRPSLSACCIQSPVLTPEVDIKTSEVPNLRAKESPAMLDLCGLAMG